MFKEIKVHFFSGEPEHIDRSQENLERRCDQ